MALCSRAVLIGCLALVACGDPNRNGTGTGDTLAGAGGLPAGTGGTVAGAAGSPSGGGAPAGAGGTPTGNGGGGASAGGTDGASGGVGAVSGGTGAAGASGTFTLVFRDEFDTLDLGRWQLMTHSWEGNVALFSTSAASVADGRLNLALLPAPSGTVDSGGAPKQFLGAEVRSRETITYGRVRARARFARGSAVISALVTIYTPWPADDWNEFDIECLGKDPANVQFNAMVYTGPAATPPVTTSVTPTPDPEIAALGFEASADFHVYTIEWTPSGARFLVDDVVRRTWSTRIDLVGLPQNTLLTIWASSSAAWAGAVGPDTGQAVASYDWVELHRYTP